MTELQAGSAPTKVPFHDCFRLRTTAVLQLLALSCIGLVVGLFSGASLLLHALSFIAVGMAVGIFWAQRADIWEVMPAARHEHRKDAP
jgi:hypothetical protein